MPRLQDVLGNEESTMDNLENGYALFRGRSSSDEDLERMLAGTGIDADVELIHGDNHAGVLARHRAERRDLSVEPYFE
jgi:hypothetical protein